MHNTEALKAAGLSRWEAQTYLALLELGETKTGALAKKAEVPQAKIYGVLEALITQGLASYITKGQTKHYQASDPKRLLALIKQKEENVQALLKKISQQQAPTESVELFQGLKALRVMLATLIEDAKPEEPFYGYSTGETSNDEEIEKFYEWWGERKRQKNLKDHLLISEKHKTAFEKAIPKDEQSYVKNKTRYTPISFPGDTAIFRKNVILFNYENSPSAILIRSEKIAQQYHEFFEDIWKQATKS